MAWKLQSILWMFLPESRDVSFTLYLFGLLIVVSLSAFLVGLLLHKKSVARYSLLSIALTTIIWIVLYVSRPAWLAIASQPSVPMPTASPLQWEVVSPGMEVAELNIHVGNTAVDRMVLVRMDPHIYQFNVHWDPTGSRTAEQWQKDLGVNVVVNGSYFDGNFYPLTPLRRLGKNYGPTHYQSSHGAFVVNGSNVDIIDLNGKDVSQAINRYPDAIVSYPLIVDPNGVNRATESNDWLASRNFVAIDHTGKVILGSTETGFFSIKRLGDFLKASPLDIRVALNLDGGPLVSQVIQSGSYSRNFHGIAEISNAADVVRASLHHYLGMKWQLPLVLTAQLVSSEHKNQ
ncbi:MAG TPA: phosphodiester glycosidase family protein [Pseudomonadales bacterium]|nr:phosphodiester glycosidase family protein [Pseudomonadales bacterium]